MFKMGDSLFLRSPVSLPATPYASSYPETPMPNQGELYPLIYTNNM